MELWVGGSVRQPWRADDLKSVSSYKQHTSKFDWPIGSIEKCLTSACKQRLQAQGEGLTD